MVDQRLADLVVSTLEIEGQHLVFKIALHLAKTYTTHS